VSFASARTLLCVAVGLAGLAVDAGAQSVESGRNFTPVPNQGQPLTGKRPLRQQQTLTVILKLAGDPVAVVRGRTRGKRLSAASEQSIVRARRSQQDALTPLIQAHGVKILAKLQYAINGIKVRGTPEQIAELAKLPEVVAVKHVGVYTINNATSVPFIGAPTVWQGPPGLHGEGIKVAVLDTGIDYTHANFGGPGTAAAFQAAASTSTSPANPTMFGPNAPKVKGGTDLVGDNYNANNPSSIPQPDPNPLDCNGHGSHVAGTVGGFGVTAGGTMYTGPYDSTTPSTSFLIGPGVAPQAYIYSVRVFGCSGSTNVVTEAIDWAIANHMDVISMSLGSNFGPANDADAEAANNAANAGIIVVAASGNAGNVPYITSSPAAGDKAISVAAMDSHQFLVGGINIAFSSGINVDGVEADTTLPLPSGSVPAVILTSGGSLALGCSASDYPSGAAGALVIVSRGTCTFATKAALATAVGAVAIGVVNNTAGFFSPLIPGVTIPFLELKQQDAPALAAAPSPETATVALANIANPTFRTFASFTSSGPRSPDSHLKPNISAPGVNIVSTLSGSGYQSTTESGTSMATPHVAGTAALALQAHPAWSPDDVRLAILNSADPIQLTGFTPRLGGSGLVQPIGATQSSVIARSDDDEGTLNFGMAEFSQDFQGTRKLTVVNNGTQTANFNVSVAASPGSSPHTPSIEASLSVGPGQSGTLHLNLSVPAATSGDSSAFREVAGLVTLTPASGFDNSGVSLNVPYYLVPRARSLVSTTIGSGFGTGNPSTTAQVSNTSAVVNGTGDFYAWGLSGQNSALGPLGLRAVGVQSFDLSSGKVLVFAVNSFAPWTYHGGTLEFDILLDINGDGIPDYDVFSYDYGSFTTGAANGQIVALVKNLATNTYFADFFASAPDNGSTIRLPVLAAHVGVNTGNPRFSYSAESFDFFGNNDVIPGSAKFNAFNNSITTAAFVSLGPGGSANVPLSINSTEFATTPALGEMIVTLDNFAGAPQAQLLQVTTAPVIAASATAISSTVNPSAYGQSVTFTSTVSSSSGTPTGTVTFADGSTTLGTGTLNSSGQATFATAALSAGPHSISAAYGGDVNFASSTSSSLSQTVTQAGTTLALASSPNPSSYSQTVTLTATISPQFGGQASGTITFKDGATTLMSVAVNTNQASYATALAIGTHSLTASYSGDANFTGSGSAVSQVVNKASSTTVLVSSGSPSVQGKSVKFTATVSSQISGVPTGKVTFLNGTAILATKPLSAGVASFSTSVLPAGSYNISAAYTGDANFIGGTSNTVVQVVKAAVSTVLTSSPNPSSYGDAVTFTATLSPAPPDGETVTFMDGSAVLGTGTLSSGVASFITASPLKVGSHSIKAVYAGDGAFAASTSAVLKQAVGKAATTTVLTSAPNPSSPGQAVTFTATVTSGGGTPTGSATFYSDGIPIATKPLSSGVAIVTTSSLTVSHTITAIYNGSTNFAISTSAPLTQNVQ
jgi:minor extracellular serine protease Vpr